MVNHGRKKIGLLKHLIASKLILVIIGLLMVSLLVIIGLMNASITLAQWPSYQSGYLLSPAFSSSGLAYANPFVYSQTGLAYGYGLGGVLGGLSFGGGLYAGYPGYSSLWGSPWPPYSSSGFGFGIGGLYGSSLYYPVSLGLPNPYNPIYGLVPPLPSNLPMPAELSKAVRAEQVEKLIESYRRGLIDLGQVINYLTSGFENPMSMNTIEFGLASGPDVAKIFLQEMPEIKGLIALGNKVIKPLTDKINDPYLKNKWVAIPAYNYVLEVLGVI